jgi:hypothetical protein
VAVFRAATILADVIFGFDENSIFPVRPAASACTGVPPTSMTGVL